MPAKAQKDGTLQVHPDLVPLIPRASIAENYIMRDVAPGLKDIQLYRYARKAKDNILLAGPTGPGKTVSVLAYAAVDGLPVATIPANGGVDPATLFGQFVLDGDGKVQYVESDVTKIIRYGGLLYIDEVNFLHPKVTSILHPLLDDRRYIVLIEKHGEVIEASDDLQVIAAYNPGYEGTRHMNQAFMNRFPLKVEFDYDPEIERKLVYMPVLVDIAQEIRKRTLKGDVTSPTSTTMLIKFSEYAQDLGLDFAISNFLNSYNPDERGAVREVLDLNRQRLSDELKAMG